jgi:hypothetical protein
MSSYTDSVNPGDSATLQDFIKAEIASHEFPQPDEDTLYVIYLPMGTNVTIQDGSQSATTCVQAGGYHNHTVVTLDGGATLDVPYALIPQCFVLLGIDPIVAASHEIIEAATDPVPTATTANGYYMDQTRDAWLAVTAAEVADVCALLKIFAANPLASPSPDETTEGMYTVQRSWSNTTVRAGHAFCQPAPAGPYVNVAPSQEKLVMHTGDMQVVELTAFSDQPTSDWSVRVVDFGQLMNPFGTPALSLQLDSQTANNGSKLHLTVKVTGTVDPMMGAPFVIVSTSGSDVTFWPMIVETQ